MSEFLHWPTHEEGAALPSLGADGGFVPHQGWGVVLVLLPAGSFGMGSQKNDPDDRSFDSRSESGEGAVHEVSRSRCFMSRDETTQARRLRVCRESPSQDSFDSSFGAHTTTPPHPVEQVSWIDCRDLLERPGLGLPTEAQWEYGARGDDSVRGPSDF